LYVTRLIYVLLVDKLHIKNLSMLPLAIPALNRMLHPNINWMKYRLAFVTFSLVVTGLCFVAVFSRGKDLLDNEFRGGTKVTIQLAKDKTSGKPILRSRAEMQEKLKATIERLAATPDLLSLRQMEPTVVMLNPEGDVSNRFVIKTTLTDTKAVNAAVSEAFRQDMDQTVAIKFDRAGEAKGAEVAVLPITVKGTLRENFENSPFAALPGMGLDVSDYVGGGAAMLTNLKVGSESPTLANLEGRLGALSTDPAFAASVVRRHRVVVMDGDEGRVTAAAVLFVDPQIKYESNTQAWTNDVRISEWNFVNAAFGRENTLAGLESFSPSIAASFTAQAIVATLLSAVLIIIYVWVRFASFRFSVAAIVATLHDCVVAVGFIAMSGYLVKANPGLADAMGIRDFKIDLNVVAAVLTILGYSLNDTIVILDRVRETKGKLAYASEEIINRSINETLSRTFITSGTTVIATTVLYIFGGEAVRAFAFCFLVGVVTGTYSSVAIACPIVWTRKANSMAGGGTGRAPASIGTIPGTKGALPA
jgi:SecD/SecF fusion protein